MSGFVVSVWPSSSNLDSGLPSQDEVLAFEVNPSLTLFAVFDGHGKLGSQAAKFFKDKIPSCFQKHFALNSDEENQEKQALKSCLDELITLFHDSKELSLSNGTTVSVILLNEKKQKVWIENIGDSTCVLYRRSKDPLILTEMHQLSNPLEFERVKQSGAKIDDRYIIHPDDEGLEWPKVIQLTRTVGDLEFSSRAGIIHQPFETEVDIVSDDQYLVLASDGLWDLISPKDLMGLLDGSPQDCLNKIQEAIENNFEYIPDDIGLVIKKLN